MTTRLLNVLLRVALLVTLLACAALFVDYSAATPSFCGVQSGCATVRTSAFSHVFGIPLPHLALPFFTSVFALAVWARGERPLLVLAAAAGVAGVGAVGYIGLQLFVVKAVCKWCMAVDGGAIVAAVTAIVLAKRAPQQESTPLRVVWTALMIVVVAAPIAWPSPPQQATVPASVAELYQADKVNIVMFTDFECPFCRKLHPIVEDFVEANPGRVNLVRVMKPLRGHRGAEPAALAYICASSEQRAAMADRLYHGTSEELTPKGVVLIGKGLGLDAGDLGRCMSSQQTRDELSRQGKLFTEAGLRGLPSLFVEHDLVQGADVAAFEAATSRAIAGNSGKEGTPIGWMFGFVGVLVAGVVVVSMRAGGREEDDAAAPDSPLRSEEDDE
jgi:uncharacterized membrane protein/predicted DsbA family dithiol-disulfide isomerase